MIARLGLLVLTAAALAAWQAIPNVPSALPDEWLDLPAQPLEIDAKSPLDLSGMTSHAPAGSQGAMGLDGDGRLVLGQQIGPRFNCAMLSNGPGMTWTLPSHAEADRLAEQLKRHGYNLVRFHFMDGRLMSGASQDFGFDPEKVDRFHYLLAALKRSGIYWMLDIMTSPDGARRQNYDAPRSVNNVKARLNFDDQARRDWLRLLDTIFSPKNPYTGTSTLRDPALAFVVGANENSIAFWSQISRNGPYPAGLADLFDKWVHKRFSKVEALSAALPDLSESEKNGTSPVAPPPSWTATGPRMDLFRLFISDLELSSYRWITAQLRQRGFTGPVLAFHEWYKQVDNRTRSQLPVTDIHAYVGEVSSFAKGAELKLPNTIDDVGMGNWLTNAGARWLDRPFVVSEYGMPFPNPYRRESGLTFPAIAAFQDYSTICRMASMTVEPSIPTVGPGVKPIYPYSVGLDPVSRVGETLAALIFYRRDVSIAGPGGVAVPFGETEMRRTGSGFIPLPVRRAALLTRFGLIPPDKIRKLDQNVQIVPLGQTPYGLWEKAYSRLVDLATGSSLEQTTQLVTKLRQAGVLTKLNRTDTAQGIYESQNGQFLLDQKRRIFQIITPRTEGVSSLTAQSNFKLKVLSVEELDRGGLIAASALDGKTLHDSDRILLMMVGDARNSDMVLSGSGENKSLVDWGKLPIQLQRLTARISIAHGSPFRGHLVTLSLNGRPLLSKDIASDSNDVTNFSIDTATIRKQPTTFFLLERAP
jgi:hypothetical protein